MTDWECECYDAGYDAGYDVGFNVGLFVGLTFAVIGVIVFLAILECA